MKIGCRARSNPTSHSREKPESEAEARAFLSSYSNGSKATCVNGMVVHNLQTGVRLGANELASVSFNPLPQSAVDAAIAKGDLYNSAGAFAVESPFFSPHIRAIDGSREAVIGLPIDTLRALLAHEVAASASRAPVKPPAAKPVQPTDEPALPAASSAKSSIPSAMVPGLVVRPMQPDDEEAARALFASGMREVRFHQHTSTHILSPRSTAPPACCCLPTDD